MVHCSSKTIPPLSPRIKIAILLLFLGLSARSQNLILLKSFEGRQIPERVFLAGDFNNWNPADSNYLFKDGALKISLSADSIAAKLTGGNWSLAEGNADGSPRPNRNILLKDRDTIVLHWYAWEDHQDHPPRGVHLIKDSTAMTFQGASRKVWVYLPEGYEQTDLRYPVFYFHDGQNLFQGLQGSGTKWDLAKTLDSMQLPIIAVAIEHGGAKRIDELSLYPHEDYGGGEGYSYLGFIHNQVIPFIDSNYRSKADPQFRYIAGSSLGGLISLAALRDYPHSYGGALIFSPAYWFNPQILSDYPIAPSNMPVRLVYQMCGDKEGGNPQTVIDNMEKCDSILRQRHPLWSLNYKVVAGGEHNEELWQAELPEALIWFFRHSPLQEYLKDVRGN